MTKSAPPPINTGKSFAHANTFPDKMVSKHELAAAAVRTGPRTTIIIPKMKMSDLTVSRTPPVISSCAMARLLDSRLRELVLLVG